MLVTVHDLEELLRLFSVVNGGRNIALVKLQYAFALASDEDLVIWSQILLENGLLLLLDSALRPDFKPLFGSIPAHVATRLSCNHSLLYSFLLFAVAFDRGVLDFNSPISLFDLY